MRGNNNTKVTDAFELSSQANQSAVIWAVWVCWELCGLKSDDSRSKTPAASFLHKLQVEQLIAGGAAQGAFFILPFHPYQLESRLSSFSQVLLWSLISANDLSILQQRYLTMPVMMEGQKMLITSRAAELYFSLLLCGNKSVSRVSPNKVMS